MGVACLCFRKQKFATNEMTGNKLYVKIFMVGGGIKRNF